jgi:hypothetical protein
MLLQVFPWPFWSIRRSVAEAWHEAMKQCQNAFQKCLLCLRPITDLIRSHPLISHKFLIIASALIILHPFSSTFHSLVKVFAVAKCNLDRKVAFSNPEIIYQLKAGVTGSHWPYCKAFREPFPIGSVWKQSTGHHNPSARSQSLNQNNQSESPEMSTVLSRLVTVWNSFNQFSSILLICYISKNSAILSNNKSR